MGAARTLGFLYPGHAAEDDFARLASLIDPSPTVELVHTELGPSGDAHTIAALHDMGQSDRLAAGAAHLPRADLTAVVWSCTSGSFVYGWEGAHEQARRLSEAIGLPASSASLAFVNALKFLGVTKVSIAATYPADVSQCFVEFLEDGGFQVLAMTASDIATASLAGELDDEGTLRMALAGNRPDAEVLLVPDTALHTVSVLNQMEKMVSKPVLTANQVCVWEAMRLAGVEGTTAGAGRLFEPALQRTGSRS